MRFYGLSYNEILELPVSLVYELLDYQPRIQASEAILNAHASGAGFSGSKEFFKEMEKRAHGLFIEDPDKLDRIGLEKMKLRMMRSK